MTTEYGQTKKSKGILRMLYFVKPVEKFSNIVINLEGHSISGDE